MILFRSIAAVILLLPAVGLAEDKCPWLNPATAGGVLGGEVSAVSVTLSKKDGTGHCDFSRTNGRMSLRLFIDVEPLAGSYRSQCGSRSTPAHAIGNEAFACSFEGKPGETAEQVIGRVRNQTFLVRFTTSDPAIPAAEIREKARKVAEQVAGILF